MNVVKEQGSPIANCAEGVAELRQKLADANEEIIRLLMINEHLVLENSYLNGHETIH
jgi:hypothetical protein